MNMNTMDMGGMSMDMASSTTSAIMNTATTSSTMDMMNMMSSGIMTSMSSMSTGMSGMDGMSGSNSSTVSSSSMNMKMSCTMSMLWNWYTDDVCFISKQWKTSTKAKFGGTCVGVFALLLIINWWRRILVQYKIHCTEVRKIEVNDIIKTGIIIDKKKSTFDNFDLNKNTDMITECMIPLMEAFKHEWFWVLNRNLSIEIDDKVYIYPSIWEHTLYCIGDTIEWSVHHVIMLLFMYFNGYVFISCMIGAGVGYLLFQYKNINISKRGDNVSKRCCL